MGKGEGFSIGNINESLRKRAGKALGVIAAAALAASGCAAPTSETKPADTEQGQENTQTDSKGNPDLDWQVIDWGCRDSSDCEPGERTNATVAKACDGTTLLYRYSDYFSQGGFTAIPNSPECGYIPLTAENSPAPTAETTPTPANGN